MAFNHFGARLENNIFELISESTKMLDEVSIYGTFPIDCQMVEKNVLKIIQRNSKKLSMSFFRFLISDTFISRIDLNKIQHIEFINVAFQSETRFIQFIYLFNEDNEATLDAQNIQFLNLYSNT